MDEKMRRKQIRKDFGKQGWLLLIYYGLLNASVILVMLIDSILRFIAVMMEHGTDISPDFFENAVADSVMGNAWGYFLAAGVGFFILWVWKGTDFTFREMYTRGKPMKFKDLIAILCIFMTAQLLFQIVTTVIELILNIFGLSAMAALEAATLSGVDTFSMFLYAGLLAPVAEEILFRGLILRNLLPYGKKVAIFVSALLFGLYHGNIVQSPFAFAVGLVLGYVAVEYSIVWAMALHMFNNLIISDMLSRLTYDMNRIAGALIQAAVIYGFAVAGIVFAILRRKEIGSYLRREPMNRYYLKCCFSSAGMIVLMVVMVLSMVLSITVM